MNPRHAFCSVLAGLLLPALAISQPSPLTSTIPDTLRIVPVRTNGVETNMVYTVTILDALGFPIPGAPVQLDFTGCTHAAPSSQQTFPGMTVISCAPPILGATTNALGQASFLVRGSVFSRGGAGTGAGCVAVFAGAPPVFMGPVSPSAYDQDGVNGLTANDLGLMVCDLFSAPPVNVRSDLNGDGTLNGLDLAAWLDEYFVSRRTSSTASRCDGGATTTAPIFVTNAALRLAWNQCAADGGTQTRTFACNVNGGSDVLVPTFVAPAGVEALTGFEAELVVTADAGSPLPAWWRMDPAGCRNNAFSVTVDPAAAGAMCPQVADADVVVSAYRIDYPDPQTTTPTALIRIVGALNPPGTLLTAGQEYSLCRLRISHSRTVGAGSCAGCGTNVAVEFRWLRLTQPATAAGGCGSPAIAREGPLAAEHAQVLTGDFELSPSFAMTNWVALWQGTPTGIDMLGVPGSGISAGLQLACTSPSHGATRIQLVVPRAQRCSLALFDVAGRRRRLLLDETLAGGARTLSWDGRDGSGAIMPSGYYVLRLVTEDGAVSRPIIHLD